MKNQDQGYVKSVKTDKGYKGMNPSTMQRRPNVPKPSKPQPFKVNRPQGR